jgi:predicted nicotinamide N-methyase
MQHPFSYKDRSGFLFYKNDVLYRQINSVYKPHYDALMQSGLYSQLVNQQQLIPHTEITTDEHSDCYKIIQPQQLVHISYAYEWCFAQLQQAAVLTLQVMQVSIAKGLILKDATPYNVQYLNDKPIFIDTLSFEQYDATKPWVAYYQFCETFLYPLLLAAYNVQDVHKTFTTYPDGIASEHVVKLLPKRCKFNTFNYLHLYLLNNIKHNKSKSSNGKTIAYSSTKMQNLITYLLDKVQSISLKNEETEWNTYYAQTIINQQYLTHKKELLHSCFKTISHNKVVDFGCNDGVFSIIAAQNNNTVFATDFDERCVQNVFAQVQKNKLTNIYPLVLNIMQPSTAQGFFNTERKGFLQRNKIDVVLMLAVVHHLVISKNLTFAIIAEQLYYYTNTLIIEYVPKDDEKVKILLANKEDIFTDYTQQNFETTFTTYFNIKSKEIIMASNRVLYVMEKKE